MPSLVGAYVTRDWKMSFVTRLFARERGGRDVVSEARLWYCVIDDEKESNQELLYATMIIFSFFSCGSSKCDLQGGN